MRLSIRNGKRVSAAFLAILPLVGCAADDTPELATVEGTVKLNGEPLPNATVEFVPETGRPSEGTTNDEGRYQLRYTQETMGALPGQHTVRISTYQEPAPGEDPSPEKVPPRYNKETELTKTVEAGANTIDFNLETKEGEEIKQPPPTGC